MNNSSTTKCSVSTYLGTLHNLRYSDDSIKVYAQGLNDFSAWALRNLTEPRWSQITTQNIQLWIEALCSAGYSFNSIMSKLTAVRTYYRWLCQLGAISHNPAQQVRAPRAEKKQRDGVTEDIILKCLKSPCNSIETKAQIALLWETGIRISELLQLSTYDIDKANQRIMIHGKGNKERWAYYGALTKLWMNQYVKHQGKIFTRDERGIRYNIHNAISWSGGDHCASPHRIRHGYATRLLNQGCDIATLSRFMGHEHIMTTERYARLNEDSLRTRAKIYQS